MSASSDTSAFRRVLRKGFTRWTREYFLCSSFITRTIVLLQRDGLQRTFKIKMDWQTVQFNVLGMSMMTVLEMLAVQTQQLQNAVSVGHPTTAPNFSSLCFLSEQATVHDYIPHSMSQTSNLYLQDSG
ncbi:hypothetical protein TNCT_274701 [Trichonephila clavata]|uniref:Uncharacterized protein n=1 Tax=Trichonephila clavata TaxID=2740835 RepID=A0A8X6K539_TRICU|nr:hypothetical protein TNCT_274701 [Trichonephila clavata]